MDAGPRIPHRWKIAGAIALAGASACALIPISNTVASHTDSEFANGSFSYTALAWSMESSSTPSVQNSWSLHPEGSPANLTLTTPTLIPGVAAYRPFALRVAAGSAQLGGTVTMGTGSQVAGTIAGSVRMRTVVSPTGTCDATTFTGSPSFLVGTSSDSTTTMTSAPNAVGTTVAAPTATGQAGAATTLCFEFTIPAPTETADEVLNTFDALNGKSATVTWSFKGKSVTTP